MAIGVFHFGEPLKIISKKINWAKIIIDGKITQGWWAKFVTLIRTKYIFSPIFLFQFYKIT